MATIDKVLDFIRDDCGCDCKKRINGIFMEKRYIHGGSYMVYVYRDSVNASIDILVEPGKEPVIESSERAFADSVISDLEESFCWYK